MNRAVILLNVFTWYQTRLYAFLHAEVRYLLYWGFPEKGSLSYLCTKG